MKIRRNSRMDITSVSTVVAIVVITYLIGLVAKAIPHIKWWWAVRHY